MSLPVVVAITGATGVVYGIEMLRVLKTLNIPTHLVISENGARTIELETGVSVKDVRALATETHSVRDVAANIASGSFRTKGMIVAPCSIKSLSGIANAFSNNLVIRAADVTLKEKRPLVLMVREAPLHKGHLQLMAKAADLGAIINPPMPAFYNHPQNINDQVRHIVGRTLDLLGIENDIVDRWQGP